MDLAMVVRSEYLAPKAAEITFLNKLSGECYITHIRGAEGLFNDDAFVFFTKNA